MHFQLQERRVIDARLSSIRKASQGGAVENKVDVAETITDEEVRSACDLILGSKHFVKAHRMQRLLRFLIEQALAGKNGNTSEYVIGIEVFDRNPKDYVSEDPAVRVQVGRLRQRLASYYREQVPCDGIMISIPVGKHMPVFHRMSRPERNSTQSGCLVIRPIRHIAESGEGQSFASGLYEELLNQLYFSFGEILTRATLPMASISRNDAHQIDMQTKLHHLIEGSVRVDSERIRASIRLVDFSLSRITWARHFDRSVQFGIREQEELATSICDALKEVVHRFQAPRTPSGKLSQC